MSTLKNWFIRRFRLLFRVYPEDRPLIYVCSCNGVTGVVRAEDFDAEVHRFRKSFGEAHDWPQVPIRPMVFPIFLFGRSKDDMKRDFRTGDLVDFWVLVGKCVVEERSFLVPDAYDDDMIPMYYPLVRNGAMQYELTGREGSRFTKHTLAEVNDYILKGKPLRICGDI